MSVTPRHGLKVQTVASIESPSMLADGSAPVGGGGGLRAWAMLCKHTPPRV